MVTNNVYSRVFQLKVGTKTGTCFVIDVDNKQYLITARHIIDGLEHIESIEIELFHDNQWKTLPVTLVGKGNSEIDIAVFTTNIQLVHSVFTLESTMQGCIWGQDVFFLGFPFGLTVNVDTTVNNDYPLPFVKKAVISNIRQGGVCLLYLDGHNNPGFSGGPVVSQKASSSDFKVVGVISGYRCETKPVYEDDEEGDEKETANWHKENTGIIISYGINHAIDLIHANPIGCPITI